MNQLSYFLIVGFLMASSISSFADVSNSGDYKFSHDGSCTTEEKSAGYVDHGFHHGGFDPGFRYVCLQPETEVAHAKIFTGTDSTTSFDSCQFPDPSAEAAKHNAEVMAQKFCTGSDLIAKRVSDFSLVVSDCVTEGGGFTSHLAKHISASASYICQ